ncbi:MAG: site-specific integrase [Nitrospiraceae bacterium]|nr:site-specific integrase [Nitrospira sp.]MCA9456134.1 site-specific integrase [Nitrospira sp.]MCB9773601.1 site-specific integrase [Nitrospiraceae bacterium]
MAGTRRTLIRKEEGIFAYRVAGGERFAVRMEYRGQDVRKFGFGTISKARHWRDTRKGRALEGRLFPEQEARRQEEALKQRDAETEQQRRDAEAAAVVTLKAYGETFMKAKRAAGLKHTTIKRYDSILRIHLTPAFGALPLAEVTRGKVRELVSSLSEDGRKPKTIKNVLLCLSALFTEALEDGHVQHNPALKTSKLIKTGKCGEEVDTFSHEEECRVLQTTKEKYPHYYPFILLLFRTGMREGEAVALRPEDLDLRKRYVWVQRNFTAGQLSNTPKSRQKRKVDLAHDLVAVLRDYLVVREAEAMLNERTAEEWLFTTPGGDMIRSNNFRDRVWKPLLRAAGIPYRWIHATRHAFASRMILSGANVVYVQRQLGHASIQLTVDTYTHWLKESERGQNLEVDRLSTPFGDGVGTLPGTLNGVKTHDIERNEEKWGE